MKKLNIAVPMVVILFCVILALNETSDNKLRIENKTDTPEENIATSNIENQDIINITDNGNESSQSTEDAEYNRFASDEADFTFDVDTGKITSYKGNGGNVVIPSTIAGYPVKYLGYRLFDRSNVTSITVPNGITIIPGGFCSGCDSLEKVVLPNTITQINEYAFRDCSQLSEINVPDNLTTISYGVFSDCPLIKQQEFLRNGMVIGEYAFQNTGFDTILLENITVGNGCFRNCKNLKEVTINNVGADELFSSCVSLEKVTIKNNSEISAWMFNECINLENLVIPNSVERIGKYAFYNCSNLKTITIPASVKSIDGGIWTFDGCPSDLTVNCEYDSKALKYCLANSIKYNVSNKPK